MSGKDCDTEASYRYINVTVCERCRQNGPNEYLKASAPAEDSKLACNPPAFSPPALSCLSSRDPKPFHVGLFCAPSVLSCVCVHAQPPHHLRLQPIPHSSCPPLVMPALCPSCSTPSQTCLRAAATKTLRKRRKIFHIFSLGAGTRRRGVVRVCACECSLRASCMFSGLRRLVTNGTQIWHCS